MILYPSLPIWYLLLGSLIFCTLHIGGNNVPADGTVRINRYRGILEVYKSEWKSICDYYWTMDNTHTVCRQMGFRRAIRFQKRVYGIYSQSSINNVRCTGKQLHINDCDYIYQNCERRGKLAVYCDANGCESLLPNLEGRSQFAYYYSNREWHYICGDGITQQVADVVCRENANTNALSYQSINRVDAPFNYSIYPNRFNCTGSEMSLCNCTTTNQTCASGNIVQIRCDLPRNGELRLSEGHQGILDFYRNGWNFACSNYWNDLASDLVCRTLGFRKALTYSVIAYRYENNAYATLNGAQCDGYETNIEECEYNKFVTSCSSYHHVNITCTSPDGCESFAPNPDERNTIVQYYKGTQWFYICADNFSIQAAEVVCRENLKPGILTLPNVTRVATPSDAQVYDYSFNCQGNERSLCNCSIQPYTCKSKDVVRVRCPISDGSFRLSKGDSGILEQYNNNWRPVCDYNFNSIRPHKGWEGPESIVACKTLGFRTAKNFSSYAERYFRYTYASYSCFGNETSLNQCDTISRSICYSAVQITCLSGGCESFIPYAEEREVVAQMYTEGAWYTLCGDGFTQETADVICRENGHMGGALSFSSNTRNRSQYQFPIYSSQINCRGDEKSVCDCHQIPFACLNNKVAAVQCRNHESQRLRLTNGAEGQLLVNRKGWKLVCSFTWRINPSRIACREMGFRDAISYSIYTNNINLTYSTNYSISDVRCQRDNFNSIFDCNYRNRTNFCSTNNYYVTLKCSDDGCESYIPYSKSNIQEVRYYTNRQWYYVCSDALTKATADVICRENGGFGALSFGSLQRNQTMQNYSIYQQNYNCNGSEKSLCDCTMSPQACLTGTIATVECIFPENEELRLSNGNGSSGILEMYYKSSWGYVCDDYFNLPDANVACKQLGFRSASSFERQITISNRPFVPKLNRLICTGKEKRLLDCQYYTTTISDCQANEGVYLSCRSDACKTYPQIYRPLLTAIRVFKKTFQFICAEGFTKENAQVICSENAKAELIGYSSLNISEQIHPKYPIDNLRYNCFGDETSLCNCPTLPQICQSKMISAVRCNLPSNGEVRLSSGHAGLLEIYFDGWGYVCDDGWLPKGADVACRMLGFSRADRSLTGQYHPNLTSNFNFNNIRCVGNESNLLECKYSRQTTYCYGNEHVYLECAINRCESYAPYAKERSAVLQYYNGSQWYHVCADNFSTQAGEVVCQETAETKLQSITNISRKEIQSDTKVYNYSFNCRGNEKSLCDCEKQAYACMSDYVVRIRCMLPEYGSLRLTGLNSSELQIYRTTGWRPVCISQYYWYISNRKYSYRSTWGGPESNVACRNLGFRAASGFSRYIRSNNYNGRYSAKNICFGNETSMDQCYSRAATSCSTILLLTCIAGGCESFIPYAEEREVVAQMYTEGAWYTLCGDGFTQETGDVICRENGHLGGASSFSSNTIDSNQYPILNSQMNCRGDEENVCDCPRFSIQCPNNNVTSIRCRNQDSPFLRLTNGKDGLLLINNNGWGYVCLSSWNRKSADVSCRAIGFRGALSFSYVRNYFNLTYPANNMECLRDDYNSISNCFVKKHRSSYQCNYRYVYLNCRDDGCESFLPFSETKSQEVRYFTEGQWYYVCSEGMTKETADVICKENGASGLVSINSLSRSLTLRNYQIHQYRYQCSGNEGTLCNCATTPQICSTNRVAELRCYSKDILPRITSSSNSVIQVTFSGRNTQIRGIECIAVGYPKPELYWTRERLSKKRFGDSTTLQVRVTDLSEGNIFYCVAENKLGRVVVSVTYNLVVTEEEAQKSLQAIMTELTDARFITGQTSGDTADLVKIVIEHLNDESNVKDKDRSKVLESAIRTTDLIVEKMSWKFSDETAEKMTGLLSSIVKGSSIIEPESLAPTEFMKETTVVSTSKALAATLSSLENFSKRLIEESTKDRTNSIRKVESGLITIVVQNVNLYNRRYDRARIILPKGSNVLDDYSVSMNLSMGLAWSLIQNRVSLAIATSIVRRTENIKSGSSRFTQGSDILNIALPGKSGSIDLMEEVKFSFDLYSKTNLQTSCVFLNGTHWISEGLTTVQNHPDYTNCSSPHLTSFAVFIVPKKIVPIAIYVTSNLFVCISFVSLLISLILFIAAGKPFFKVETNIIYFNYCLSMLLATGSFALGIQVGTYNHGFCSFVAFLQHYSWLAVFNWTLCIGLFLIHKFIMRFCVCKKSYKLLIPFGWVFPIVIPIITISITREYYVDVSSHCFLNAEEFVVLAIIIPILIIIAINTVFLTIAAIGVKKNISVVENIEDRDNFKSAFITGLIMTPVLGLPWLILIFNVSYQNSAIEWTFYILNSMMGVVFFFVIVVRNKEVRAIFRKKKLNNTSNSQPNSQQIPQPNPQPNHQPITQPNPQLHSLPPQYLDIFGSAPLNIDVRAQNREIRDSSNGPFGGLRSRPDEIVLQNIPAQENPLYDSYLQGDLQTNQKVGNNWYYSDTQVVQSPPSYKTILEKDPNEPF